MMTKEEFIANLRNVIRIFFKGTAAEHNTLEAQMKYLEKVLPDPLIPEKNNEDVPPEIDVKKE